MEKPDWVLWDDGYKCLTLEECVCLSLNAEPEIEQCVPFDGGVRILRYTNAEFTGALNTDEGRRRLETLRKHFKKGSRLLPPQGWRGHSEDLVTLLHFARWANAMQWPVPEQLRITPATDTATPAPVVEETKEQRQDRRLKACEAAGLVMPKSSAGRLPDGVGAIADDAGFSRQAFSADVKAALQRRERATREGVATVHRA